MVRISLETRTTITSLLALATGILAAVVVVRFVKLEVRVRQLEAQYAIHSQSYPHHGRR